MLLHPEIQKFWQKDGSIVWPTQDYASIIWKASTRENLYGEVVATHNKGNIRYRFEGKIYSEEEMLKIIKLKAFV